MDMLEVRSRQLALITLTLFYIIPIILMFLFNCLLIGAMCVSRRTLSDLTTVNQTLASQISPTCKVIWVITVFLITQLLSLLPQLIGLSVNEFPRILNSSVNIIIYYATSQKFRRALAAWLCSCKRFVRDVSTHDT